MVVYRDSVIVICDVGDDRVQSQSPVVGSEKGGCLPFDESVEPSVVKDVVVLVRPLIKRRVLSLGQLIAIHPHDSDHSHN